MTTMANAAEQKREDERRTIEAFSDFSNIYNFKKDFTYSYKTEAGLTEDIVRTFRLKKGTEMDARFPFEIAGYFSPSGISCWGPDISELHMDDIVTYVRPNTQMKASWDDVPDDIKDTFDRLGIPEAEKTSLAGVGASTIRKSYTTAFRKSWCSRASSTRTLKRHCGNTGISFRLIS